MSIGSWFQRIILEKAVRGAVSRLTQASTWIGILGYFGLDWTGALQDSAIKLGVGIASFILVFIDEKKLFSK